jgi:hypothetical protein
MKTNNEDSTDPKPVSTNEPNSKAKPSRKTPWKLIVVSSIIVGTLGYHFYKVHSIENEMEDRLETQTVDFQRKIDSLNLNQSELTARTLSWAIRGEMIRGNKEQVTQYLNEFVHVPNIIEVNLLKPDGMVELSTNVKNVGTYIKKYKSIIEQQIEEDSTVFRIITPITHLNSKMNVLLVDVQRSK